MKRTYEQFSSTSPQPASSGGVFMNTTNTTSHPYHNSNSSNNNNNFHHHYQHQYHQHHQQDQQHQYHQQQSSYHYSNNNNNNYQHQQQSFSSSPDEPHYNNKQQQQQHYYHQQDHENNNNNSNSKMQNLRWHMSNETQYKDQQQTSATTTTTAASASSFTPGSTTTTTQKVSIIQTSGPASASTTTTGRIILPSFKNFMDSIDKSVESASSSSSPTALVVENNKKRKLSSDDNSTAGMLLVNQSHQERHSSPDLQSKHEQGGDPVPVPAVLYPPAPVSSSIKTTATEPSPQQQQQQSHHHRLYITQTQPIGMNSNSFVGSVMSQPEPSLSSSTVDPYASYLQKEKTIPHNDMYSQPRDTSIIPGYYTQPMPYDQVRRSSVSSSYGSLQVSPPPSASSFYSASMDPMLVQHQSVHQHQHQHQPQIQQQYHSATTTVMYPPQPPTSSSVLPMMYSPPQQQHNSIQNAGVGLITIPTRQSMSSPQSRSNSPNSPPSSPDTTLNGSSNTDLLVDDSNYQQLQPIRILAYRIGLSKDPNKSWRYRDIKRSLFEKTTPQHANFIEKNLEHSLLKQRLPHKLSMCSFAKRIMLLVFHFILRDGREPKFWRRSSVKADLVEKILQENDAEFYSKINKQTAIEVHAYTAAGMSIEQAIHQHQLQQKQQHQSGPTQSNANSTSSHHTDPGRQQQQLVDPSANSNPTENNAIK